MIQNFFYCYQHGGPCTVHDTDVHDCSVHASIHIFQTCKMAIMELVDLFNDWFQHIEILENTARGILNTIASIILFVN